MTPKEKEVLQALKDYIEKYGYAPSFRELGTIMGISSSATISHHLVNLKKKGYIDYANKKSRTIKILKMEE